MNKFDSLHQKLVAITLLTILVASSLLAFIPVASAATPPALPDDYASDYGVLHDDTYILYPWDEESINIGFSKCCLLFTSFESIGPGKTVNT